MTNPCSRAAVQLVLISCLALPAGILWAQNENDTVGFQTNHIFESGQFGENIDILNGGVNLSIPIGPKYQVSRFLAYQLQLAYGSKIWDHTPYPSYVDGLFRRSTLGLGFSMHFGRIYKDVERVNPDKASCVWYYVSPDGNEHALPPGETQDGCDSLPANGFTVDRSYYRVEGLSAWDGTTGPAPILLMYTPDNRLVYEFGHMIQVFTSNNTPLNRMANTLPATSGEDTNYNRNFGGWYVTKIYDYTSQKDAGHPYGTTYISIEYDMGTALESQASSVAASHAIKRISDSLGRVIEFMNECAPTGCQQIPVANNNSDRSSIRTTSITIPAFTSTATTAVYSFAYAWRAINNIDADQVCPQTCDVNPNHCQLNCPNTSANVLTDIIYPPFSNHSGSKLGYRMTFDYGPYDPLQNGEIYSRTLPTGAQIAYQWGVYYYLSGGTRQLTRKILYMIPGGPINGDWTYTREAVEHGTYNTNPKYVTVKDPLGNETVYHYRASLQRVPPPPDGAPWTDFDDGYAPEWDDGVNERIEYYEGNGPTRKLIRAEDHQYEADPSTVNPAKRRKDNVRESRVVTTYSDDGGTQAVVEYRDWNDRGFWREKIESGDGIAGARKTRTQYKDPNITQFYGSAGDASLFDYSEVTDGARVVSRTENVYDASNRLTKTVERAALPATVNTGVSQQSDAKDVVTAFTYDANSNVVRKDIGNPQDSQSWQITNPQISIGYGYLPGGYLRTKQFYNVDSTPAFPWYAIYRERDAKTGLIYKTKDTAGVETNYEYDALGRVKDIQPAGLELSTAVEYVSANNSAVCFGAGTTYDCDQQGTTGDFILTCYTYDALGRLSKTQQRSYDSSKKAAYQTTSYQFLDAEDHWIDAMGRTTFQSEWLWPDENPCAPIPLSECGTTYDYGDPATFGQHGIFRPKDPFGRPRTVKAADGKIIKTAYFGQSSMVTVIGVGSLIGGMAGTFDAITRYTRDVWGRLVEVLPPSGGAAKADYTYDLRDNVVGVDLTDPVSLSVQTRSFEYDGLNRLRASVNPENGSEVITGYDVLRNVTAKTDSSGNHTFMTYDRAARLTQVARQEYQKPNTSAPPLVTILSNTYDMAGASACPSTGADPTFGYCDGKLTKSLSYDDLGNLLHTKELNYLGLNGRISKERNLFRGWKATAGDILDASILYDYNTFGLVNRTTYPEGPAGMGGALATTNVYSNGFLKETWDACHSGSPCVPGLLASATYNAAGGMQAISTEGGVSTNINPDTRNRPSKISIGKGTYDPVADTYSSFNYYRSGTYAYDGAGNIYQIGSNLYGYDGANRLVQAKDIDPSSTLREQSFLYDAFGNMTEKTLRVNNAPTLTSDDVYTMTDGGGQTSNRIQQHTSSGTAYTVNYDARGNIGLVDGRVFESDSRNRMVSVRALGSADKELARYAYDGSANRVSKDDRGRDLWTFYVRDLEGRLMSEFRMSQWGSYTPEWAKHYLYLGSRLVGMRDNQVPSPPSGLNATISISGTTAFVTLSWRSNPAGEGATPSKYTVYRSVNMNAPEWTPITTVTSTSYVDTVAKGSSWKYLVTAVVTKPGGVQYESYGSDTLIVRATSTPPRPNAPTGLTTNPGNKRVLLIWNALSATDLLGYHVYRRVGVQAAVRLTQIPIVQTSFLDQGYSNGQPLVNGTTYYYSISALNSSNLESTGNAEVPAIPNDYTPPGPPLGLKATPACDGTGHVNLTWKLDVVADQATYQLYRRLEGQVPPSTPVTIPMGSQSSYTDLATVENKTYTYWVRATDSNNNLSEESLHVSVKTRAPSSVAAPQLPYASSGDRIVNVRIPILAGDPPHVSVLVYRKPNTDLHCEGFELVGPVAPENDHGTYADFPDGTVWNGVAYDYAVTYVTALGAESGFSKSALGLPVEAPSTFTQCSQTLGVPLANWRDGGMRCNVVADSTDPYRRLLLRWQPVSSVNYQPLGANNADGTLAYLMGYRIYRHATLKNAPTAYDGTSLLPLQTDFQKPFCQAHPDIACGYGFESAECPAGDHCDARDGTTKGVCEVSGGSCYNDSTCSGSLQGSISERCVAATTGKCHDVPETFCNVDAQCPAPPGGFCINNLCTPVSVAGPCSSDGDCSSTQKCVINNGRSPYLSLYQDSGVNTFIKWTGSGDAEPQSYDGSCLTATAVYRIYANGEWRVVESGYADNFDSARQDSRTRCVGTTWDMCETDPSLPGQYRADTHYRCSPVDTLPPTPGLPRVTLPPASQTIMLDWDAPRACEPAPAMPCAADSDCPVPPSQPPDQYCRITFDSGLKGFCKFKTPIFCSDLVSCAGGLGCESRETEVAGYYIYASEKSVSEFHFKPGSPVAATDSATRSYEFSNLAPLNETTTNDFSFRVASFDRGGRVSVLSPSTPIVYSNGTGGGVAAPGSVKTVVWSTRGPSQSVNAIKVKWLRGASYTSFTGYRLWRSASENGPYCALIVQTDPGTGQISTVCKDAASLAPAEVTTASNSLTKTSFIDDTAQQGIAYYYAVTAVVSGGQQSSFSQLARGLLLPRPDQSLSPPDFFKAEAPNGVVEYGGIYLSWCPNPTSEGVTSYNVYRSPTPMRPYTQVNLIAKIPAVCLNGHTRCEIGASQTPTQSTICTAGIRGNCRIVDTTGSGLTQATTTEHPIFYYVVTAVRDLPDGSHPESGFSKENQGRPNYHVDTTWGVVYDPDNFPEGGCGEESAALHLEHPPIAQAKGGDSAAPYRVIGQTYNGPTMPAAVPRFVYFHLNHLGSPIVETTASGGLISTHHYMPFGEEMPAVPQDTMNKRHFTGHERDDETGLDYMKARYYSSLLDRFLVPDPVSFISIVQKQAFLSDPQTWNKYSYALNNPLQLTDHTGRIINYDDSYRNAIKTDPTFREQHQKFLSNKEGTRVHDRVGDAKDVLVVFKAVTKEQMINLFGKDVAAITIYVTDTKGNLVKGKPEGDAVVYVNPARVKDKQIYEEWRHAENDTLDNPNDLRKRTEVNNDIDAHPSRDEGMQRFQRDRQGEEGSLVSGQDPMTLIDGLDTRDPFSGKQ